MTITLIDARSDALTVTWPATEGATNYKLEYRTTEQPDFSLLSDTLTQPQARKRNLSPDSQYYFRVAALKGSGEAGPWVTHENAFQPICKVQDDESMPAPTTANGGNQALVVSWNKVDGATGYELQMRENKGGEKWTTIATSLSGTEVKKKNLPSKFGYQFRVRPAGTETSPFSPPCTPVVAKGLSLAMQKWFSSLSDGTLLRSKQSKPVPLVDALAGKEFVLLYASAHWCPPCRKFTPMLANWYQSMRNHVEVVFLSCDHDEQGFTSYFQSSHPWMAVDYDDDAREQLLATIRVQGIPRLVVLHAETGQIVEDNAVGQPLGVNRWRGMVKK